MSNARRFIVHGLLGKGGFGEVYRATLETNGFRTEVALKVLHTHDIPDSVIARFKDEANVLGLIRDPAVVRVYPPIELNGRPALVMEFVDGESTARLIKRLKGPLPPRVATSVIAEVARALHDVYQQPGPEGEPLQLVHRDLKPGNLQITPTGGVKVLDFGLAKASYDGREAQTTAHLFGTPHYMAPERTLGVDGPASDVFSLGVTWRRLLFGDLPVGGGRFRDNPGRPTSTPVLEEVEVFLERMLAIEPEARPSAQEVEAFALAIAPRLGGSSLREWAQANVEPWRGEGAEFSGQVLEESVPSAALPPPPEPAPTQRRSWIVLPVAVVSAGMLLVGTVLLIAGVFLWSQPGSTSEEQPVLAEPAAPSDPAPVGRDPAPPEPLPAEPVEEPATVEPTEEEPPADEPPAEPAPVGPAPRTPAAMPRAPDPSPAPAAEDPTPQPTVAEPLPAEPPPLTEPVPAPPVLKLEADGAVLVFKSADGRRHGAEGLEPGTYAVEANFDASDPSALRSVGTFTFSAGSVSRIKCVRSIGSCKVYQ